LERDGGSIAAIISARQAIRDLHERSVSIRRAIQEANATNTITVEGETRSIADWLVWRREVAPKAKELLSQINSGITQIRQEAKKRDVKMVAPGSEPTSFNDLVVNVNEADLAKEIEHVETVLGSLDGQLSLKNATLVITV
jgi:hypothetical protein